jgi:hypothetical protein
LIEEVFGDNCGNCEVKRGSFSAASAFGPNLAAVGMNQVSHNRQANAGAAA